MSTEWEVIGTGITQVDSTNIGLTYGQARARQDNYVAEYIKAHPGVTAQEPDGDKSVGFVNIDLYQGSTKVGRVSIESYSEED